MTNPRPPDQPHPERLRVGDRVEKCSGSYLFPGVVVAAFDTLARQRRVVVECTEPGVAGLLHVYSESQLRLTPEEHP